MPQKHCKKAKENVWIHYKPSLFQHIGTHSSLKGKVQKLKASACASSILGHWSLVVVKKSVQYCDDRTARIHSGLDDHPGLAAHKNVSGGAMCCTRGKGILK